MTKKKNAKQFMNQKLKIKNIKKLLFFMENNYI